MIFIVFLILATAVQYSRTLLAQTDWVRIMLHLIVITLMVKGNVNGPF